SAWSASHAAAGWSARSSALLIRPDTKSCGKDSSPPGASSGRRPGFASLSDALGPPDMSCSVPGIADPLRQRRLISEKISFHYNTHERRKYHVVPGFGPAEPTHDHRVWPHASRPVTDSPRPDRP